MISKTIHVFEKIFLFNVHAIYNFVHEIVFWFMIFEKQFMNFSKMFKIFQKIGIDF
jgi:hypothetical protein